MTGMQSSIQKVIIRAFAKILRPLLKLWLRYGLSYQAFEEMVRWVMVDIAVRDFPLDGRKQTDSRISVITGLTRHQVKHYRQLELEDSPAQAKANRATRVLTGWLTDSKFQDDEGKPLVLDIEHDAVSFRLLCESHAGDVPFRSILDELLSHATVEIEKSNVRLISRGFVPNEDEEAIIEIIGQDASSLLNTLEHNLHSPKGRKWFQKKVSYGELPLDELRNDRPEQGHEAQKLLESLNGRLSKLQKEGEDTRGPKARAGWGVYYFEQDDS
jgi:hypothetical protein